MGRWGWNCLLLSSPNTSPLPPLSHPAQHLPRPWAAFGDPRHSRNLGLCESSELPCRWPWNSSRPEEAWGEEGVGAGRCSLPLAAVLWSPLSSAWVNRQSLVAGRRGTSEVAAFQVTQRPRTCGVIFVPGAVRGVEALGVQCLKTDPACDTLVRVPPFHQRERDNDPHRFVKHKLGPHTIRSLSTLPPTPKAGMWLFAYVSPAPGLLPSKLEGLLIECVDG